MLDIRDSTLVSTLDRRAREDGAIPFAFFSHDGAVTAAQLLQEANQISGGLVAAGVKRDSRVLVLARTSPLLLASLVACWRLGAMVCPAEAFLAPQGLERITIQYRPDLILFDATSAGAEIEEMLSAAAPLLRLDQARNWPSRPVNNEVVSPEQAAVCIFTSGSTGLPKGVVHSHRSLIAGAMNVIAAKGIGCSDRALCVLPLSHLNGLVTTFVTPLVSGGTVVYLQGPFASRTALELIDRYCCTWFSAVPTQYAHLVRPTIDAAFWSLRSLRFCRSASAPLSIQIKKEFEAYYGVPIIETMGMTETAGQIFCNPMPPEAGPTGSVGRAIGWDVRVVSDTGEECSDGVVGEVQVRGSAMMSGYLDAPEETRTVFIDDWLRSGDLGWRDENGFYFLTGRLKDIAIFSGTNISLRAIEEAVQESLLVAEIACVGERDELFGERVVAYVVPNPTSDPADATSNAVVRTITGLLPSAQALKEVRFVADLPRSSVGKVLKGRLSELEVLYSSYRDLPRDPRLLVSEILHVPLIEIHEDMALGSTRRWDSLAHVSLICAAETLLGRQLQEFEMLALTTFRGLKRLLEGTLSPLDIASVELDAENREQRDLIALMVWNRILPGALENRGIDIKHSVVNGARGNTLTSRELTQALRSAGLCVGDTLLLHADVSSLGLTEAGHDREAILAFHLDCLRQAIGESGTLAMCTSFEDYGRYGTPFILEESPSRLGSLSEYVRTRPGAVRSIHPIVSVTALGPAAEDICGGSHYDGFGYDSPWGRLHRANAKLMTLGMGHYPEMGMTFLHYVEHAYGVPYQYNKIYTAPVTAAKKIIPGPFTMSVRYLDFGITYDTNRFKNGLVERGLARLVPVGNNSIFCTTANEAMTFAVQELQHNRYYFLKNAPNFRPGEVPMDGATGKMQYVYDRPITEQER